LKPALLAKSTIKAGMSIGILMRFSLFGTPDARLDPVSLSNRRTQLNNGSVIVLDFLACPAPSL
jgi:hypothetical protein